MVMKGERIMKKMYKIPVSWQMIGTLSVEAESIEEAIQMFDDAVIDDDLPWDDAEYSDGSYGREHQLGMTDEEYYRIYNPHISDDEYGDAHCSTHRKTLCTCEFCGCGLVWDELDSTHGNIWFCEDCGKAFCSKCFADRFGTSEYCEMIQNGEQVLCPECYKKN